MKIYLSSAENQFNASRVLLKIDKKMNLLLSYYYLAGKSDAKIRELLSHYKALGYSLFLDSGAFTFLNEYKTRMNITNNTSVQAKRSKISKKPTIFAEEYLAFLALYKEYFDCIVELDIDLIVGYNQVKKWRKQIIDLVGKEKIIIVFHETIPNAYKEWETWCKEYKDSVLGIGGISDGGVNVDYLFKKAVKHKIKVHGFAMTKTVFVIKYPWFSVDSSSWNTGQRFGRLVYFNKKTLAVQGIVIKTIKTDAKLYSKFMTNIYPKISTYCPVPISAFLHGNTASALLDICNVHAFLEQERILTELWAKRGIVYKD